MRIVRLLKSASSAVCNFRGIRFHFFRPCTHFYFSLPTEKFMRGQGEKNTPAEKGNYKSILGEMGVSSKKGASCSMTHPLLYLTK